MSSEILLASRLNPNIPVTSLFVRKELVGKGAYGGVYKGVHTPTGLVVALKVIDLDTADDDISEIRKEVALLSEMREANKHNITLYHGCYLNGTELWIAMDFASGGSIRTLMKSGKIEEKYTVLIIREVLVALSFLHRQGIIHRDVKAANVLLTQSGKILLCDFGVAAHLQTNSNKRSTFIGTPLWMAPEVITDGKLYDTKADIWSLGVTLYEIATGNPPYFGIEPLRACALIPKSTPARLDGSGHSLAMKEFLAMCLQADPANRPTADDLSKSKWIKSVGKVSMSLLRELIVRYLAWIGTGGQRMSLMIDGDTIIAREDTFDETEEEVWDFEDDVPIEPLGDEPARSQDPFLSNSTRRPPKLAINTTSSLASRNHPLQRLFLSDTHSNHSSTSSPSSLTPSTSSYASMLSSFTSAANSNSMDTLRPTISIPSFEEMDEMIEAKLSTANKVTGNGGTPLRFMELPNDTISPAFSSWNSNPPQPAYQSSQSQLQYSPRSVSIPLQPPPRFRNSPPGSPKSSFGFDQLTTSASSTDLRDDRTFVPRGKNTQGGNDGGDQRGSGRNRSHTAPSSEYPPLGRGIPASVPVPQSNLSSTLSHSHYNGGPSSRQHSNNSSVSPSNTNLPLFSHRATPSATSSGDTPHFSSASSSSPSTPTNTVFPGPGIGIRRPSDPRLRTLATIEAEKVSNGNGIGIGMPSTIEDVNRPFRSRTASDARARIGGGIDANGNNAGVGAGIGSGIAGVGAGNRSRTGSEARLNSLKHGGKLQVNTTLSNAPAPLSTIAQSPLTAFPSSASLSSLSTIATPTASSSLLSSSTNGPRPSFSSTHELSGALMPIYSAPIPQMNSAPETDYPFPALASSVTNPTPSNDSNSNSIDWLIGPPIRALEYGKLITEKEVHAELERTILELGSWLGVVEQGLERIVMS